MRFTGRTDNNNNNNKYRKGQNHHWRFDAIVTSRQFSSICCISKVLHFKPQNSRKKFLNWLFLKLWRSHLLLCASSPLLPSPFFLFRFSPCVFFFDAFCWTRGYQSRLCILIDLISWSLFTYYHYYFHPDIKTSSFIFCTFNVNSVILFIHRQKFFFSSKVRSYNTIKKRISWKSEDVWNIIICLCGTYMFWMSC